MSLIDKIVGAKWAIIPEVLHTILRVASRGPAIPKSEWPQYSTRAKRGEAEPSQGYRMAQLVDGVAVLPVTGPIFPRANMMTEMSGATAISALKADFARAEADPAVKAILLDVDSPGGVVTGIDDFAARVAAARKPVVTYVAGMAASAAYWIAAASQAIIADRSAELGSIGVRVAVSKQIEADTAGEMTFDIVSSGAPLKLPDPETDEGIAALKTELDDLEDLFVSSVAAGRGVDADAVRADFGRGGIMIAGKAVAAGMADGIGTFEQAMARAHELRRAPGVPGITTRAGYVRTAVQTTAVVMTPGDLGVARFSAAEMAADVALSPANPDSPLYPEFDLPAAPSTASDAGADARKCGLSSEGPNITETNMTKPNDQGGATAAPTNPAPAALDIDAIRREAREAECARIVAIQDATIPGHEALAQQFVKEGKSPGDFALAQSSAEKAKGAAHLDVRRAATAALPAPQPQVPAADAKPKPALSAIPETDDAAKKAYAASTDLQKEFRTEAGYVAWARATREGKVRIFRSGKDEQKAA